MVDPGEAAASQVERARRHVRIWSIASAAAVAGFVGVLVLAAGRDQPVRADACSIYTRLQADAAPLIEAGDGSNRRANDEWQHTIDTISLDLDRLDDATDDQFDVEIELIRGRLDDLDDSLTSADDGDARALIDDALDDLVAPATSLIRAIEPTCENRRR